MNKSAATASLQLLGKTKLSQLVPIMKFIAFEWGLNLSKDTKTVEKILKNSVVNN